MTYEWFLIALCVIAIILLIYFLLAKHKSTNQGVSGIESVIGEKCVVTEKIDNYAGCGQVKINGQLWSARSAYENDVFEEGDQLSIVAIEGVKLICKK
ncbi:MAG: NfeD family protein [Clostridia bacterium]|nr:NfeD family protein [Clostridia bacterium]